MSDNRSTSRGPRQRRGRGKRVQKQAVLLLVEGAVTEKQYFEKLKEVRGWANNISLTVQACGKTPLLMAKQAEQSLTNDEYDYAFLVFDKDELTEKQIQDAVSRTRLKNYAGKMHVCVSAPKFEIWLCAHHQMMKQGCDDRKVTNVERKLDILQPPPKGKHTQRRKHMPSDFPYQDHEIAAKNTNVTEFGKWDSQGSTSIPKVIELLDTLNK